ncbi:MAG: class I SAM-dependent methyltransferase [Sulfolobaceae archaeon]|nr:class I SAM-dependent methyltransferase [Sulfolobaceae archaeon]
METLKNIFKEDLSKNFREAEEISYRIDKVLRHSFPYALSRSKRPILYAIVKTVNPKTVIETGIGPGVSSTMILSALETGTLYSIDVRDKLENGKSVGFLVPEELRHKWKVYIGESRAVLPKVLNEVEKVDVFLHDSEHTFENVMFELTVVWEKLRRGGIILIDNLDFTDAPVLFSKKMGVNLYRLSEEAGGFGLIIK